MTALSKLCFVVGPIGAADSQERKVADLLLNMIVRPVVSAAGYEVKRADEDARPGSISQAVIRDVLHSDLVIADLTGFNPNAFYELGIRHSAGKPTIHIIAEHVRLPFDNIDQRTIFVDLGDWTSICSAKGQLEKALLAISAPDFRDSNPVTQAQGSAALAASSDSRDQQILALQDRLTALEIKVDVVDLVEQATADVSMRNGKIRFKVNPHRASTESGRYAISAGKLIWVPDSLTAESDEAPSKGCD